MVDLHLHSCCSDGLEQPESLVVRASDGGDSIIALTDHDTLDGLDEFFDAGRKHGVRTIAGVEITCSFVQGELHLLGYGFRRDDPALTRLLTQTREAREKRNRGIFSRMGDLDLPADYESWRKEITTLAPGRPHIADHLIRNEVVKSRREAFDRYLSEGRPLYLKRENPPWEEAAKIVRAAGGLAVVAHPLALRISRGKVLEMLDDWKMAGIAGIETIHPTANYAWSIRLAESAARAGLLTTGGSDFHGIPEDRRFFGKTAWGDPIPPDLTILPLLMETTQQ